jgi:hypothetical protein
MTFNYEESFATSKALEGYERLILLAMLGDQSLFTRADGIERVWAISSPLLESPPPVLPYARGSWGPPEVDKLVAPYKWHLPERRQPGHIAVLYAVLYGAAFYCGVRLTRRCRRAPRCGCAAPPPPASPRSCRRP